MTDRFNTLTVVLEKDMRDEDAEVLINAISQFRGVISVCGNIVQPGLYAAQERAKYELRNQIIDVLTSSRTL